MEKKEIIQPAPAEEKEEIIQPAPAEEKEDKKPVASQEDNQEIDYKAELEKAQSTIVEKDKQISQAEHTIVDLKKKKKEENDYFDEFGDEVDEKEDARKVIREELSAFRKEQISSTIDEEIAKLTDNPDERVLIRHHYDNTINQSGTDKKSIVRDITSAYAIANSPKILKDNKELKEAIKSKKTVSNGSGGSAVKPAVEESGYPEELSDKDIAFLKKRGITPDKYNKINNS